MFVVEWNLYELQVMLDVMNRSFLELLNNNEIITPKKQDQEPRVLKDSF